MLWLWLSRLNFFLKYHGNIRSPFTNSIERCTSWPGYILLETREVMKLNLGQQSQILSTFYNILELLDHSIPNSNSEPPSCISTSSKKVRRDGKQGSWMSVWWSGVARLEAWVLDIEYRIPAIVLSIFFTTNAVLNFAVSQLFGSTAPFHARSIRFIGPSIPRSLRNWSLLSQNAFDDSGGWYGMHGVQCNTKNRFFSSYPYTICCTTWISCAFQRSAG